MKNFIFAMIAAAGVIWAPVTATASSSAFSCADASGMLTYDGQEIIFRSIDDPKKVTRSKGKKISETLLETSEETCTNKAGKKFRAGFKTSLVIVEYPQSWDQKNVRGRFICMEEYDTYPNVNGIDTKCVKTVLVTETLKDTSLVKKTTEK